MFLNYFPFMLTCNQHSGTLRTQDVDLKSPSLAGSSSIPITLTVLRGNSHI